MLKPKWLNLTLRFQVLKILMKLPTITIRFKPLLPNLPISLKPTLLLNNNVSTMLLVKSTLLRLERSVITLLPRIFKPHWKMLSKIISISMIRIILILNKSLMNFLHSLEIKMKFKLFLNPLIKTNIRKIRKRILNLEKLLNMVMLLFQLQVPNLLSPLLMLIDYQFKFRLVYREKLNMELVWKTVLIKRSLSSNRSIWVPLEFITISNSTLFLMIAINLLIEMLVMLKFQILLNNFKLCINMVNRTVPLNSLLKMKEFSDKVVIWLLIRKQLSIRN